MAQIIKRPDITILEDKVAKIESVVPQYEGYNMYHTTEEKLKKIAHRLISSGERLLEIVGEAEKTERSARILREFAPSVNYDICELLQKEDSPEVRKKLVKAYTYQLNKCAMSTSGYGCVDELSSIIWKWFDARYLQSFSTSSYNFTYNPFHIAKWIDGIILTYSQYLHIGKQTMFIKSVESWLKEINDVDNQRKFVPPDIWDTLNDLGPDCCTREAVYLEKLFKDMLYQDTVFVKNKTSIRQIVIANSEFTESDLDDTELQKHCYTITETYYN